MHVLMVLVLLVFFSSCGKPGSSAGMPVEREEKEILPLDGSNIQGIYLAKFTTLNPHINGTLPGSTTVMRTEDKFYAYVRLFAGAPEAWHQQNIHIGLRCPTLNDDLNKDGFLDIEEVRQVVGEVLIPLDANITSQAAGKNIYPVADASGSYFYERITSFDRMFADLKSDDKNLTDEIAKIAPEEGLKIEGKVVIIQGAGETAEIPLTVATTPRRLPHQTLPIACGIFKKVTKTPGDLLDEEIPGPVDENGGTEPQPTPEVDEETDRPLPPPDYSEEEPESDWVDRVLDWWRSRWDRWRGDRPDHWGDGESLF